MEYELDDLGYVLNVYFGCNTETSTLYEGDIPDSYETLQEWAENEDIREYKIVEGNLAKDNSRAELLQAQYEEEHQNNRHISYSELKTLLDLINTILGEQAYKQENKIGKFIKTSDITKAMQPVSIKITDFNPYKDSKINLFITGKNLLFNTAITETINGITFTQNADKSITIDGTATGNIEYNIGGTSSNTSPFLVLKKDLSYYLSTDNLTFNLYNYDGTDRTEIYSGAGGELSFTEDELVTQVTLSIPSSASFEEQTIYPQLEYGTSASDYETYTNRSLSLDLSQYLETALFPAEDLFPGDDLYPEGTSIDYLLIEGSSIKALVNNEEEYLGEISIPFFTGINLIYTIQDYNLDATYYIDELDDKDVYATKIELNNATGEINLEVAKKVDENEVISKINLSPEEIQINANKVSLAGKTINLTSDNIQIASDNFSVDADGNIAAHSALLEDIVIKDGEVYIPIQPDYDYTQADATRIQQIILGTVTPTQEDYAKYDFDGDGQILSFDWLVCQRLVNFNIGNSSPGKILFKADSIRSGIYIKGGSGQDIGYLDWNNFRISDQTGAYTVISPASIVLQDGNGNRKTITPTS